MQPHGNPWEHFDLKQYALKSVNVANVPCCAFEEVASVKRFLGSLRNITSCAMANTGCVVACDGSNRAVAFWPSCLTASPIILQHENNVSFCCASPQFVFTVAQIVHEKQTPSSTRFDAIITCCFIAGTTLRASPLQVSYQKDFRVSCMCVVSNKAVVGGVNGYFHIYTDQFHLLQREESFSCTLRHVLNLGHGYFAAVGDDAVREAGEVTRFPLERHDDVLNYQEPFLGTVIRIWSMAENGYSCLYEDCIGREEEHRITAATAAAGETQDGPDRLIVAWDDRVECYQFTTDPEEDDQEVPRNDLYIRHEAPQGSSSDDDSDDENQMRARLWRDGWDRSAKHESESSSE